MNRVLLFFIIASFYVLGEDIYSYDDLGFKYQDLHVIQKSYANNSDLTSVLFATHSVKKINDYLCVVPAVEINYHGRKSENIETDIFNLVSDIDEAQACRTDFVNDYYRVSTWIVPKKIKIVLDLIKKDITISKIKKFEIRSAPDSDLYYVMGKLENEILKITIQIKNYQASIINKVSIVE